MMQRNRWTEIVRELLTLVPIMHLCIEEKQLIMIQLVWLFVLLLVQFEAQKLVMLEAGCGVGNCIFPLLEDDLNLFIYACDFSPRAVEFVKVSNSNMLLFLVRA